MRRFRPTWWGTLLTVVGVAAGIRLGYWQTGRAEEKLAVVEAIRQRALAPAIHVGSQLLQADDLEHRILEARGRFDPKGTVFLDNRVSNGRAGYEVIMPLRIEGSQMHLLVNRGWIAATGDRRVLPEVSTPDDEVSLQGIAAIPGRHVYELSQQAVEGAVWQNLSMERYRTRMGYTLQPVLMKQTTSTPDGLVRDWSVSERRINVHKSYAFQWFALAGMVFIIYLFISFRRDAKNT